MILPRLRVALAVCAVGAGAAVAMAVASETWMGLVPCALCLVERWPYRVAAGLALLGLLLPRPLARLLLWAVLASLLAAAAAAAVHVGVERHFWASPLPQCAAPHFAGLDPAERLRRMSDTASRACEDPTRLFAALPLSLAELNLIFALAFCGLLATFLLRTFRSEP